MYKEVVTTLAAFIGAFGGNFMMILSGSHYGCGVVMVIVQLLQQVLTGVMSPFRLHHYRAVKN